MRNFVESLKRLYQNHMLTDEQIMNLINNPKNKITQLEKDYILGKG